METVGNCQNPGISQGCGYEEHSMYYCSLVLNRDMQNYCYGVVQGNVKMCDLIVSKKVEKECLEKSK